MITAINSAQPSKFKYQPKALHPNKSDVSFGIIKPTPEETKDLCKIGASLTGFAMGVSGMAMIEGTGYKLLSTALAILCAVLGIRTAFNINRNGRM